MGAKKPYGGFFLPKFSIKKAEISCNVFSGIFGVFVITSF
jgi:hypothetical protein